MMKIHGMIQKIGLISILLFTFLSVYSQTDTIENLENMGTARGKINATILKANNHSDSITSLRSATSQNYGFISAHNDSIAAHLVRLDNLDDSISIHRIAIDNINEFDTTTIYNHLDTITINATDILSLSSTKANIATPTFTGKVTTAASSSGSAGFNLPHGTLPSSAINGDVGTTTAGFYAYINGEWVGPFIDASNATNGDTIYKKLTDYESFLFGSGVGLAGDTILIDALLNGYGYASQVEDSMDIKELITNITDGDSVNFSLVYNDSLWVTAECDTICTVAADSVTVITTSFNVSVIPENNYIWVEMDNVVAGRKPVKFRVKLYWEIKRD